MTAGTVRGVAVRTAIYAGVLGYCFAAPLAHAVDYNGTVSYQGQVVFDAPIAGINLQDIVVDVKTSTEATGNGVKCSISSTTSDNADVTGAYPDTGQVSSVMLVERGGPNIPDGECIVTVTANGSDGVSVSARGAATVFVPVDDVNTSATLVVSDITVRQSKAIAGLDKDCFKWVKKQAKKRAKCNDLLLKKGNIKADKCKDAGPEPLDCDPGDFVESIVAFAYAGNDQQLDPPTGLNVDQDLLKDQTKCQKRFGKAAVNYTMKRSQLADKKCVAQGIDSDICRDAQAGIAKKKLDQIDKCVGDQMVDGATGLIVPDVTAPCDVCIDGLGALDRKCLKSCFQLVMDDISDGLVGDVPLCGNGIVQTPEFCDDGNTTAGDCCSDSCTVENLGDQTCGVGACEVTVAVCTAGTPNICVPGTPGVEGPNGDATCTDGIDNDCDNLTDGADPNCL